MEKIADAVLHEGFLLYPYRKSSIKNQRPFHFGTIYPRTDLNPGLMQTECLVAGSAYSRLHLKIRFLQSEVEQEFILADLPLETSPIEKRFSILPLQALVEVASAFVAQGLFRLTVRISNVSETSMTVCEMQSTHTLMGVEAGEFLSLLDPPAEYSSAAAACRNIATWPVLGGSEGQHDLMLSSPVILYDYPQVAPESAGNLFDGTEIEEILSLRVLTLSPAEKQEMREAGGPGLQILERLEALSPQALAKMHAAMCRSHSDSKLEFRAGDRVRLRPSKRADIFDIVLDGKVAIVEAVERDFEDKIHLSVTVEDDPGRDLGVGKYMGHRFFFAPEEVELL
jgi:hypothetical protein